MGKFFRCSCRKKNNVVPFVQVALPATMPQPSQQQLVPRSPVVTAGQLVNMSALKSEPNEGRSQLPAARACNKTLSMDVMELFSLD